MRLAPAVPLADLTEREWSAQVSALAKQLGWLRHHHYRSDRSEPGWPDEALLRERLLFLELKTEKGKLSDAQKTWIRALLAAGCEVYVVRPRDLEALAKVLACRGRPFMQASAQDEARQLREETVRLVAA